jgi:hypothetical protein
MSMKMLRLAASVFAVAVAATPASAFSAGCPSHLSNGSQVCHNTGGTECKSCTYNCSGTSYTWNVCDLPQ